jgi:hypothetical protein
MAFTIHQQPAAQSPATVNFIGTKDYATYVVEETDAPTLAQPRFSYFLRIEDTGTVLVEVLSARNQQNCGTFDIARLLDDYVNWDETQTDGTTIHKLIVGEDSVNLTGFWSVKVGYRYALSATSSQFAYYQFNTDDINFWKAGIYGPQLASTASPLIPYIVGNIQKKVLSLATTHYVGDSDWGIFAVTNNLDNTVNTRAPWFEVVYYDSNGTALSTSFLQNVAADATGDVVYFFCGPANLKAQTQEADASPNAAVNSGWVKYTIKGVSTNTGTASRTQVYTFNRVDCSKYQSYRLAFPNKLGGWDYVTFDKASQTITDVKSKQYTTSGNTAFNAGSTGWNHQPWQGGAQQYEVEATQEMVLNTGFRGEELNDLIEGLVSSPKVYIQEFGWMPVVITSRNVVHKKSVNQELVQHSIGIRFGKKNKTL